MHFDYEKHLAEPQRVSQVGTWEWDVATDTIIWCKQPFRIFGIALDAFTASFRAAIAYVHPDDRKPLQGIVERAVRDHMPFQCEYRVLRPDGAVRWVHALGGWSAAEGASGTRMYGTAQDITERKQIEDALWQSESRLRVLLDERERIARDLHDKLLPDLYAIGLSIEGVDRAVDADPAELQVVISRTVRSVNHAIDVARALVDESQPVPEVDLEQELRSIALAAEGVRNVRVLMELDRDALAAIPPEAQGQVVGIVREAVSNSLRHSAASLLMVSLKSQDNAIRLAIEDNGTGFDAERMRGTGRGLPNMSSRAREIGGELAVSARPAGGTSVFVDLPVSRP